MATFTQWAQREVSAALEELAKVFTEDFCQHLRGNGFGFARVLQSNRGDLGAYLKALDTFFAESAIHGFGSLAISGVWEKCPASRTLKEAQEALQTAFQAFDKTSIRLQELLQPLDNQDGSTHQLLMQDGSEHERPHHQIMLRYPIFYAFAWFKTAHAKEEVQYFSRVLEVAWSIQILCLYIPPRDSRSNRSKK